MKKICIKIILASLFSGLTLINGACADLISNQEIVGKTKNYCSEGNKQSFSGSNCGMIYPTISSGSLDDQAKANYLRNILNVTSNSQINIMIMNNSL